MNDLNNVDNQVSNDELYHQPSKKSIKDTKISSFSDMNLNSNEETAININKKQSVGGQIPESFMQKTPFVYLKPSNLGRSKIKFGDELDTYLSQSSGSFKYLICILLDDDSVYSSNKMGNTIKSICENLPQLNSRGINENEVLVWVFIICFIEQ